MNSESQSKKFHHTKQFERKNTFSVHDIILENGRLLSMKRPLLMGVLNVTPDSFSDGGKYSSLKSAVDHGLKMAEEGAGIIDVGGESTRPFSEPVNPEEEMERIVPVIENLAREFGKLTTRKPVISVDTKKPEVAEEAINAGAEILNDVNALRSTGMAEVAADKKVPVILMHMKGTPRDMQNEPVYKNDVVDEIVDFLGERIENAVNSGVQRNKILIDPGIGFGKTLKHNLIIMNRLDEFRKLGHPVVIGTSNKSFIGKTLDLPVEERGEGTLATVAFSVIRGASVIRAHNVKMAKRGMEMTQAMLEPDRY